MANRGLVVMRTTIAAPADKQLSPHARLLLLLLARGVEPETHQATSREVA
jgi:hypothetical protein